MQTNLPAGQVTRWTYLKFINNEQCVLVFPPSEGGLLPQWGVFLPKREKIVIQVERRKAGVCKVAMQGGRVFQSFTVLGKKVIE